MPIRHLWHLTINYTFNNLSRREYRRLLDEEMMAVCRIYAEVELADLPVREGKEARGWLTSAHMDAECA